MKRIIVSLLDWADFNDYSRTTAQVLRRAGLPIIRGGPGGKLEIDLKVAQKWLRERREAEWEEQLAAVRGNPEAMAARTRKIVAEAKVAELTAAAREGEVVDVVRAEQGYAHLIGAARERLLSLAPVLVQRGLVPPEDEAAVAKLVHEALDELAARGVPA